MKKSVMSVSFSTVIRVSLFYVHVCIYCRLVRAGWKIRP